MHLTFGHKAKFVAPIMITSKMTTFSNVIRPKELIFLKYQKFKIAQNVNKSSEVPLKLFPSQLQNF